MDDLGRVVEQRGRRRGRRNRARRCSGAPSAWRLDGVGDVAEVVAGLRLLDAEHQAFVGDVDQLARLERRRRRPGYMRLVSPCQPSSDRGHVDVDDVAVLERLVARDAVADDVVDRDAAALGVAAIAERRRDRRRRRASSGGRCRRAPAVVTPGTTCGHERVEDLGGEAAGARACPSKPSGPCSLIDAVARPRPGRRRSTVIYWVMRRYRRGVQTQPFA